jgi:phage/plasmid-associated DNA primase
VWLAANYKPEIRGSDYAIWRRIRLNPFTVTIPPEEQIPDLAEQLKEELSGILNWALEGLQDWLANGLQPPPEVTEATEAYRAEMDIVGSFVQDACVLDPKAVTPSKNLYDAFREGCAENGYEPFGQTAFGRRRATKGFLQGRAYIEGRLRRCWFGIRLRSDTDPQPDLLPLDQPDSPDQPDMTDGTRFPESHPIKSDADQSLGKTRHDLSSVTNAPDPSVTSQNPTIACHRDEGIVHYPKSSCCGEPIEPNEEGIGVCVGCGRSWQWDGTSWHPADLWEFDPFEPR